MPKVETIEGLAEAVQTLDATPLGLHVGPETDAAVWESVQRTSSVLLSERHCISQAPVLAEQLLTSVRLGGVALR